MGNQGGPGRAQKLDAISVWKEFDTDNSGIMSPSEVEKLLQTIWRRYGVEKPLSKTFMNAIMSELDVNGDGRVAREEFVDIAEELWEEREQLFAQYGGASSSSSMPRSPTPPGKAGDQPWEPDVEDDNTDPLDVGDWLHCPHCDMDIDPRDLENLRDELKPTKRPSKLGYAWERVRGAPDLLSASSSSHLVLPTGTIARGNAPASYFQNAYGWWMPDNSILRY